MTSPAPTRWLEEMEKLRKGDRLALLKVTRIITGYLTRYRAYEIKESWDDLCQEVLMALIKSVERNQIQHENAFVSYLGVITRNKLSDWISSHARAGSDSLLGDDETAMAILDKAHVDDSHHQKEDMMDLQAALDSLPEREKNVVQAIYIQGYSYEEAAEQLDMPLGTLKRMQTAGLKLLRKKMQITRSDFGPSADLFDNSPELASQPDSG